MTNSDPDNLHYLNEKIKRLADEDKRSFDGGGGGGYDHPMEERVKKLEALVDKTVERIVNIERDVAVIKSNYSTKADVSDAKNSIIMWVVGAIFVAQLLPMLKDFIKSSGTPEAPALIAPTSPTTPSQAPSRSK